MVFVATALVAVTAVTNKSINGQLVVDIAAAVEAITHLMPIRTVMQKHAGLAVS